jgi:hypothetical protein
MRKMIRQKEEENAEFTAEAQRAPRFAEKESPLHTVARVGRGRHLSCASISVGAVIEAM